MKLNPTAAIVPIPFPWSSVGPPSPSQRSPPPAGIIAGTVIGSLVILGLLCVGLFIWIKRRRIKLSGLGDPSPQPHQPKDEEVALSVAPPSPSIGLRLGPKTFTYEELALATNGFSDSNFLGEGGYGIVHKGVLPDKTSVAVKQLKSGIQQAEREFQTEVQIINQVHHRHLVSLVGYCIDRAQSKMMLVYELVPNKTLAFHLHEKGLATLDWKRRMKIAIGAAKGLAYLHEKCQPKIIHRDIKAANILIGDNFEPKVADFGLARLCSLESQVLMSRIMGTFGYLAPEYAASGKLTEKSDVFSFGVVLLELITGRKPVGNAEHFPNGSMVDWAAPLLSEAVENRNFEVIADPRLQNHYDVEEMLHMVSCAANCVRHSATRRPRMSQVVQALAGVIFLDDYDLTVDSTPRRLLSEDLKKLRKMALGSYSTTESDHYQSTSSSSGSKLYSSNEHQT
ncbi:proline-rich receptor-like protein kinase PERK15 [Prosopis cineraria]|uniref:proline-rich receptor-like protein kinase PERK15 n=1 Tax=Prosopis cineraria TaxID=364024 RepID=UPI00240ECB4D|nr:proline-rich receptor-like protein kinase PERK15 [Prosopis cineraria]